MGRCSRAGMDGRFNVARAAKDEAVVAIEAKKKVVVDRHGGRKLLVSSTLRKRIRGRERNLPDRHGFPYLRLLASGSAASGSRSQR